MAHLIAESLEGREVTHCDEEELSFVYEGHCSDSDSGLEGVLFGDEDM